MFRQVTLSLMLLLLVAGSASAQFKMEAGQTDIGIRVGTVFPRMDIYKHPEAKFSASIPALGFSFETGFWNFGLSVGGEFNYTVFKRTDADGRMTVLNGILFAKYYPPVTFGKFAPYLRADVLPLSVYSLNNPIDSGLKLPYGIYAAANYQLSDTFGAFAEVGYGYTAVNLGINLRLED